MEKQNIRQAVRKVYAYGYRIVSTAVIVCGILLATLYLCGIRLYHVKSGSMGELMPVGSVCFVSTYSSFDSIRAGDIISFRVDDIKVTHRAISVTPEGIITQGDMNDSADPDPVTKDTYIGKTVFALPHFGNALGFFQTLKGKVTLGICILLLILAGFLYKPESE